MTKNELQELIDESVITAINEQNYENAIDELHEATEYLEDCLYEEYCLLEVTDILCESELIVNLRDKLKKIDDSLAINRSLLKDAEKRLKSNEDTLKKLKNGSIAQNLKFMRDVDDFPTAEVMAKPGRYKRLITNRINNLQDDCDGAKKDIKAFKKKTTDLKNERKQLLADIKKEAQNKRDNLGKKNPDSIGAKLNKINDLTSAEKEQLSKIENKVENLKTPEVKKDLSVKVANQLSDNASKEEANNVALNTVAKNLDSNKFQKKGNKIVAVFKNNDGTANKKAIAIAVLLTTIATSVAASAIVLKKKKKAKEAKEKLEKQQENKQEEK